MTGRRLPMKASRNQDRSRAGFTLVEVLTAVGLGTLIMGAMMLIYLSTNRMGHMSFLASALQEGALTMSILQKDLTQAVQKPGLLTRGAVLVKDDGFQLIKARFKPDGTLSGTLVRYTREPTPGGNFRLRRHEDGRAGPMLPGLFHSVTFQELEGVAGGPFVRVTLRLSVHDKKDAGAGARGSDTAILTTLVRVMGPEGIQGAIPRWSILDEILSIVFQ